MKKAFNFAFVASLLAASALVTPAAADSVSPSAPTFKISGNTVVTAYGISQDKKVNGKKPGHHLDNAVSDIYFLISGRASNGIEYKMKVNMQAFSSADPIINQNYIEFNGKFGTFQAGNVVGPEDTMIEDGLAVMGGTGGADGAYSNVYNLSSFAYRGNDNIGDSGYGTKIAYYTPEYSGFRLGVAYTPHTAHRGDEKLNDQSNLGNNNRPGNRTLYPAKAFEPYGLHNIAVGLSYKKEVGMWGFNLNGAYIHDNSHLAASKSVANSTRIKVNGTSSYQLGAIVGYKRANGHLVQVGGGYLDNRKSRTLRKGAYTLPKSGGTQNDLPLTVVDPGNSGKAWNVGLGYTMGAYKLSGSYQGSVRKVGNYTDTTSTNAPVSYNGGKAKNSVFAAAVDVIPVQGIKFFGEVDFVNSKATKAAADLAQKVARTEDGTKVGVASNRGTIFMLGSKISF